MLACVDLPRRITSWSLHPLVQILKHRFELFHRFHRPDAYSFVVNGIDDSGFAVVVVALAASAVAVSTVAVVDAAIVVLP